MPVPVRHQVPTRDLSVYSVFHHCLGMQASRSRTVGVEVSQATIPTIGHTSPLLFFLH